MSNITENQIGNKDNDPSKLKVKIEKNTVVGKLNIFPSPSMEPYTNVKVEIKNFNQYFQ